MYDKILVALDGTDFAESVLDEVEDIALLNNSEVILVRVMPDPQVFTANGMIVSTIDQTMARDRLEAEEYLRDVVDRLAGKGIMTSTAVLYGQPTKEISRYASERNIGLIAMATHGRSGLGCITHDCTANKVRKSAAQPMLLFMPKSQVA